MSASMVRVAQLEEGDFVTLPSLHLSGMVTRVDVSRESVALWLQHEPEGAEVRHVVSRDRVAFVEG